MDKLYRMTVVVLLYTVAILSTGRMMQLIADTQANKAATLFTSAVVWALISAILFVTATLYMVIRIIGPWIIPQIEATVRRSRDADIVYWATRAVIGTVPEHLQPAVDEALQTGPKQPAETTHHPISDGTDEPEPAPDSTPTDADTIAEHGPRRDG